MTEQQWQGSSWAEWQGSSGRASRAAVAGQQGGVEGRAGWQAAVAVARQPAAVWQSTGQGSSLLARRGFVLEQVWVQVALEAVGPEGRVVPQQ